MKQPKLSSKSGQGHNMSLIEDGMLLLIRFHFQNLILFSLLYSQLDMTHLDTLVTFLQALSLVLYATQRTKRSHASRARGRLSQHIISLTEINQLISLPLVEVLGFAWESLLNVRHFFLDQWGPNAEFRKQWIYCLFSHLRTMLLSYKI